MTPPKKHAERLNAGRRGLLAGLGAAAAGSALALGLGRAAQAEEGARVTDAPPAAVQAQDQQSFYGRHQAGIVTPRPAAGMVVAFDVVAQDAAALEDLFRQLTERVAFLTTGGRPPELDPKFPPADSGILGPLVQADDLTVTLSLGASLFDNRPWLKGLKPRLLQPMQQFPNDALDAGLCHGDLSLQFCANSQDTNIHALRDILKQLSRHLVLKWKQEGSVPVVPRQPDGVHESARNFLGFRDGSANPDSTDQALMDSIVWVGSSHREPDWALGGSYQVVRIIRNFVERWDRTPLGEQEHIFGRHKVSGAPFGGRTETDIPNYASDPDGKLTRHSAHIRLANPRTPASQNNLILRRPFNYSNGVSRSGQLEQGLLFIAYQADLEQGFVTVQNRLNGEPLEEYIKPIGGGYFFTLPGVVDPDDYLGRGLIEAISQA